MEIGTETKLWISTESKHIFALWLQARINFFMRNADCFFAKAARWYKHQFDLLDLSDEMGHSFITDEQAVAYDLFICDLCQGVC